MKEQLIRGRTQERKNFTYENFVLRLIVNQLVSQKLRAKLYLSQIAWRFLTRVQPPRCRSSVLWKRAPAGRAVCTTWRSPWWTAGTARKRSCSCQLRLPKATKQISHGPLIHVFHRKFKELNFPNLVYQNLLSISREERGIQHVTKHYITKPHGRQVWCHVLLGGSYCHRDLSGIAHDDSWVERWRREIYGMWPYLALVNLIYWRSTLFKRKLVSGRNMKSRKLNLWSGEKYELLKTDKNTVITKSTENNEEPHIPHTDTVIRSLKNWRH